VRGKIYEYGTTGYERDRGVQADVRLITVYRRESAPTLPSLFAYFTHISHFTFHTCPLLFLQPHLAWS
jgi:hypothetical protein